MAPRASLRKHHGSEGVAAFVANHRKQLTIFMWLGLIAGVVAIGIGFSDWSDNADTLGSLAADRNLRLGVKVVGGLLWLTASFIAFRSRRQLDAAPAA